MTELGPKGFVNPIVEILTGEEVPPTWLVKDLFLQGTLVALAGTPGAGKSYLSYTVGLAVASGLSALSGLVPAGDPRTVVYFDEENSRQDRDKYLRRSWKGLVHGRSEDEVWEAIDHLQDHFWPVHYHLGGEDWFDRAVEWVTFAQPHLMIFETATPAFAIHDENDNAEATQSIRQLQSLMKLTTPTATCIILKHAKLDVGQNGQRSMRGAKAWMSAADQTMFQVKAVGRPLASGLRLTRLEPDKVRAYGLPQPVFITPAWTDEHHHGLSLHASYQPSSEHKKKLRKETGEDEDDE
jgi:hypothetical protein